MSEMAGIHQALGILAGKMDRVIAWQDRQELQRGELEKRVRKVERRQHWYSGAAAAIGAVFSLIVSRKIS